MPSTHYDIFVHGNFIIGLPSETPATVERRLRGIEKVGFDSIGGGPVLPDTWFNAIGGSLAFDEGF
jgi:hypothetical protein